MGKLRASVAVMAALCLGGCVSTKTQTTTLAMGTPLPDATVLFMDPDIELRLLTTGGAAEPRADWTEAAKTNMLRQIESEVHAHGTKVIHFDAKAETSAHIMQLVHLHEVVGSTILGNAGLAKLPNKEKVFDWSLGPGVSEIAANYHADYALFLFARGSYASAGRVALSLVSAALIGVTMPLGQQVAFASLVDLHTGNVVWIGVAATGEAADMSSADGAASVAKALVSTIPLGQKPS
jgi:hypothetical protein